MTKGNTLRMNEEQLIKILLFLYFFVLGLLVGYFIFFKNILTTTNPIPPINRQPQISIIPGSNGYICFNERLYIDNGYTDKIICKKVDK
jgi:uncharacterized protein YneF (UPF0154 family)